MQTEIQSAGIITSEPDQPMASEEPKIDIPVETTEVAKKKGRKPKTQTKDENSVKTEGSTVPKQRKPRT